MPETVHLDELDGFEFERLCERIFDRAGWGKVQRIGGVADGGRDLVIHGPSGTVVVECKHQPNSSIGRPIVQKLHSAVVSSGATKGLVITTGRYTAEAVQHAETLEPPIELFDLPRLFDLAQKASIKLVTETGDSTISCLPAPDMAETKRRLAKTLDRIKSSPQSAIDMVRVIPNKFVLEAHYVVRADIEQDFTTSVGTIHSIRERGLYYIFNAGNGDMLDQEDASFLSQSSLSDPAKIPTIACPNKRTPFTLDVTTLKSMVTDRLVKAHTRNVSYRGKNNRIYEKLCEPGSRSIRINDIKQVLLPRYSLILSFLGKNYPCILIQNNHDVRISRTAIYTCRICNEDARSDIMLCNSCGNVSHTPKFFGSHGFECKSCKKTICRECAFWTRRFLFFKKILCEECADAGKASKFKSV